MRRCAFVACLGVLLAVPSEGSEVMARFVPAWSARCQVGKTHVTVDFRSKSGDPTEDDMRVSVRFDTGASIAVALPRALYLAHPFTSDAPNLCAGGIAGYSLQSGRTLLLIHRDARPESDRLAAVMVDTRAQKVVHVEPDLGGVWNDAIVVKDPRGYRVLMNRQWLANVGDGEFPAVDWVLLEEAGASIRHRWETPRP